MLFERESKSVTRTIVLRERSTTRGIRLDDGELRALRDLGGGLRILATGRPGIYDVETGPHVGSIVGRTIRCVVHPKFAIRRLLYLLSRTDTLPELTKDVPLSSDEDLLEAMQYLYCEALDEATRHGLLRDYRTDEAELPFVRGKLNVARLVTRRFMAFPPLPCDFDRYTVDVEANRRLLAAAEVVERLAPERRISRKLRAMTCRFEGVGRRYEPHLLPLSLDRRWRKYTTALRMAELILSRASIELRKGHIEAVGFWIDMDRLFEDFVTKTIGEALGTSKRRWRRHPNDLWLDVDRKLSIMPDVVHYDGHAVPDVVVDVKNKSTTIGNSSDIYQMLAYCEGAKTAHGVIVYAEAIDTAYRVSSRRTIHVTSLNPELAPAEMERRTREIADMLRSLEASPLHRNSSAVSQ